EPVARRAHEAVEIPGDDVAHPPVPDRVEQAAEPWPLHLPARRGVVVHVLGAGRPAAAADEVETVFALACDTELVAAPVHAEPRVERGAGRGSHDVYSNGSQRAEYHAVAHLLAHKRRWPGEGTALPCRALAEPCQGQEDDP